MDKRKINKTFKLVKAVANLDYAITNPDKYGDCNTCVNYALAEEFGLDSRGIYLKHWSTGMNKGFAWKYVDSVYIAHDLTPEQGEMLISTFKENGYDITPETYDPCKAFEISEREEV